MTASLAELDPNRLVIEAVRAADRSLVTVTGDVDAVTAPTLRQSLVETLAHPDVTDVLLDLSGVTFLDSAGLTALVVADRTARATGRALTVTCGTSRAVRRPLEITGLLTVLTVADRWPG